MDKSFEDKIADGDYRPNIPYPVKPSEPCILSVRARNLTAGEAETIPAVKAKFDSDIASFRAKKDQYHKECGRLEKVFTDDMISDLRWDKCLNVTTALARRAWEYGHSDGFSEVYAVACNLCDIYDAAIKDIEAAKARAG